MQVECTSHDFINLLSKGASVAGITSINNLVGCVKGFKGANAVLRKILFHEIQEQDYTLIIYNCFYHAPLPELLDC